MLFRYASRCLLILLTFNAAAQKQEAVTLKVAGGTIGGTLTLPASPVKPPVVLIIPTAGGVNRDGNTEMVANNSLRQLADSFASRGIASLRYDKRGVGASKALANETTLSFSDYAGDASACVQWLRKQKRFSKVTILGQGEGALVGMMASKKTSPDWFIGVGSPGQRMDSLLLRQLTNQGFHASTLDSTRALFAELNTKGSILNVPDIPFYKSMFRPSVQQFLLSWIQYDPAVEIRNLRCPVLLVQGDNDLQMDTTQIQRLKAALPGAKTLVIPGMNHIFRQAPRDAATNLSTYYDSNLGPDTTLLRAVSAFIKQ